MSVYNILPLRVNSNGYGDVSCMGTTPACGRRGVAPRLSFPTTEKGGAWDPLSGNRPDSAGRTGCARLSRWPRLRHLPPLRNLPEDRLHVVALLRRERVGSPQPHRLVPAGGGSYPCLTKLQQMITEKSWRDNPVSAKAFSGSAGDPFGEVVKKVGA